MTKNKQYIFFKTVGLLRNLECNSDETIVYYIAIVLNQINREIGDIPVSKNKVENQTVISYR